MKRSLFAVIIGILLTVFLNLIIPWLINENYRNIYGRIIIFVGGIVAGYIANRKGWLHGLITGSLPYLLILLTSVLAILVFKYVLNAKWERGNQTDMLWKTTVALVQLSIVGGLLGCLGGIFGERIYKSNNQ